MLIRIITVLTKINNRLNSWASKRIWKERIDRALQNFSDADQKWVKVVLENQVNYLDEHTEYSARKLFRDFRTKSKAQKWTNDGLSSMGELNVVMFNASVYAMKSLQDLNSIISIQPITGPVGLTFAMRCRYDDPPKKDDEVQKESDILHTGQNKRLVLEVIKKSVEAGTKRLQASWSVEAQQDIMAQHGLDMVSEMSQAVGQEIAYEISNEILNNVLRCAAAVDSVSFKLEEGESYDPKVQKLVFTIFKMANAIAYNSRRGAGNVIITTPRIINMLQAHGKYFKPAKKTDSITSHTLMLMGYIDPSDSGKGIPVYCHAYWHEDIILVAYKGASAIDAGYIYSPYIMMMSSGIVIDPVTFNSVQCFMTRDAHSTMDGEQHKGSSYFGKIVVTGLGLEPKEGLESIAETITEEKDERSIS